jgi:nucleoside-diphosphate-sugar epimerase
MTRTVAVTGDSGRLGRAVVHALVDDGWALVNFDRVPAPSSPARPEDAGEGSTHG